MQSLDIIIVNWNAGEQLYNCLTSIASVQRSNFDISRVVVVDNASVDNSVDGLEQIVLPLTVIRNNENRGFAAACNQGAEGSTADFLLFLNPDTKLFVDSLDKSIVFMNDPAHMDTAILGIQLLDDHGQVSRSCARFPSPGQFFAKMIGFDRLLPFLFKSHLMTDWDHSTTREVDHVIGAFFLVRQSVFEDLNGLDERFFVYLEDLDFSYRALQSGWKSIYYADAQAYHKGGGASEQIKATRLFYSLRSRILYGYKHFSREAAISLMIGTMILEPISRTVLGIFHLSMSEIDETFKGYGMLWRDLPQILRCAKRTG